MCIKMHTAECAMLRECAHANKYKDDYFVGLGYVVVLESFTLGRSPPTPTPASLAWAAAAQRAAASKPVHEVQPVAAS